MQTEWGRRPVSFTWELYCLDVASPPPPEHPRLVKQSIQLTYMQGHKPPSNLRSLKSFLGELGTNKDAKAMRTSVCKLPRTKIHFNRSSPRSCPLCKAVGRPIRHFLCKFTFLLLQSSWIRPVPYQRNLWQRWRIYCLYWTWRKFTFSIFEPSLARSGSMFAVLVTMHPL